MREGQLMLVSAIVVSIIMMSTLATISAVQSRDYGPTMIAQDIDMMKNMGEELDLAKKSNRRVIQQEFKAKTSYSTDFDYVRAKSCYNLTASRRNLELDFTCLGNGSLFHDGFEDGEYEDPEWNTNNSKIRYIYSPRDESRSLSLELEEAESDAGAEWQKRVAGWEEAWKADGLFYTEDFNRTGEEQRHNISLYRLAGNSGLEVYLGFKDGSGDNRSFRIEGDLISTVSDETVIGWEEDTWYRWEVEHDGTGEYRGKVWEASASKPGSAQAISQGATGAEFRKAGMELRDGESNKISVSHDFIRLRQK